MLNMRGLIIQCIDYQFLSLYGLSPHHRKSLIKRKRVLANDDSHEPQDLFCWNMVDEWFKDKLTATF